LRGRKRDIIRNDDVNLAECERVLDLFEIDRETIEGLEHAHHDLGRYADPGKWLGGCDVARARAAPTPLREGTRVSKPLRADARLCPTALFAADEFEVRPCQLFTSQERNS
jgi:hypothetical protein